MSDLPKGWTWSTLGEHVAPARRGLNPSKHPSEEFDLFSIPSYDSGSPDRVVGKDIGSSKNLVEPDDILLSKIVPHIRRAWIVPAEAGARQIASSEWIAFRSSAIVPAYMKHFLVSDIFHQQFMRTVAGVGGSLLRARPKDVARIPVPLPPLDEQRRIATILDSAASLSSLRTRYLEVLHSAAGSLTQDLLIDTTNYQLFGDFLERIDSGKSPVCEDRPATGEEWSVLKLGAISSGTYAPGQNKALREETLPAPQNEVHPGDLLFSRQNTRDLVGATAFVRKTPARRLLPDLIFRLVLKEESDLLPEYVHAALSAPQIRQQLADLAGGSAASMVNISKAKLKTFAIPVPEVTAQRELVGKLNAINLLAERQHEQLSTNSSLVSSLQSRAFRGEL